MVSPPTEFPIRALCREVVQAMQGLIEDTGATVEISDDMPGVYADQARVREVIRILVENGIKPAADGGEPRVEIVVEPRDDKVLCRARDNGPGIEPRFREEVFGLFERLDIPSPGIGVGLALVKRITEIHDEKIWIEPRGDGQGCCFCFTLPLQRGN